MVRSVAQELDSGWPDPEGKYPRTPQRGLESTAAASASLTRQVPAMPKAPAPAAPATATQMGMVHSSAEEGWPDDTAPAGAQDEAAEDAAPAPLTDEQELEELDGAIKASEERRAILREKVSSRAMAARLQQGR